MSEESESDDAGSFGNRPAAGARLVDNTAELPNTFGGGQEATDFLGLSQDLAGIDAGATEAGASTYTDATEPAFGAAPASGKDSSASWLLSPTEQPETEEEPEAGLEEVEESAPVETARPRRILSLAAAVLVIGAVVTVAMKFADHSKTNEPALLGANQHSGTHTQGQTPIELSNPPGTGTGVRQGILPNGETVPVTETTPEVTPTPTESETAVATTTGVGTPSETIHIEPAAEPAPEPRAGAQRLARWMSQHGWSALDANAQDFSGPASPVGWSATAILAFATRTPVSMPAGDSVEPTSSDTAIAGENLAPLNGSSFPGNAVTNPSALSMSRSSGPVPAGALRMASATDLAGIWSSDVVPMDLLNAETRIVTPGVGSVRVLLKTGEMFDGRLYAVGQGQVWLETDIGRLALSAQHVLRIDQSISEKETKAFDALPRMRVRTPGGLFFGKILSRDEHHVTLRLEGGGRITLESTDIEAAPLGNTRVIGPQKP